VNKKSRYLYVIDAATFLMDKLTEIEFSRLTLV